MARASITKATIARAAVAERKLTRERKRAATTDSYLNNALKLGIGADNPLTVSTYGFNPITRVRTLLEWIYRGSWMGGIAVDIVADDMTRAGIDINTQLSPDAMDKLAKCEVGLNLWGCLNELIKWSRLYGGAIMVMLIDGQDMSTPLRIDEIPLMRGQLKGFLVLDRWQVEAKLERLVGEFGPDIGLPMYYRVNSDAPALRGKIIHYTRVVRMAGVDLPYWQRVQENLWGLSVFERIYDRMVAMDSSTQGAAQLVYKSFLRTYKMKGMTDLMSVAGDQGIGTVMRKMDMVRRFQSNEGLTVIDGEDDVTVQTNGSFTGISDVILQQAQQLSGTLQIPLVRMFGQSPAGLNSTGESDLRTYYDGCNQQQERTMRRPVDVIYRCMAQSEAIVLPTDFNWTFRPLWQLDEGQKSEISARDTTSVCEALEKQVIDLPTAMRELKQNSRTTGRFDNITDEMIAAAELEPDTLDLPAMGLGDDEIQEAGGDPSKVRHDNPNNKQSMLEKPHVMKKGGQAGSTEKPSADAMMGGKDKPTFYNITTESGEVVATVSKSKVLQTKKNLEQELGKKLKIELVTKDARPTFDSLPAYHVCGVQVSIENMRGTTRKGPGWRVRMPADYGHIPCVDSAEGDMEWMDAFVGPDRESSDVWIIDTIDPRTGKFDEHKCMLGFDSEETARSTFNAAFHDDGARRIGGVTRMDADDFKAWLRSGDHTRPVKKLRAVE